MHPQLFRISFHRFEYPVNSYGTLLVLGVAVYILSQPRKSPASPEIEPPSDFRPDPVFDKTAIPASERFDWQPPEVVAILGE